MTLNIKRSTYHKIINFLSQPNPKKISAIKAVRADAKCGLREAKEAVESLMYEKGFSDYPVDSEHRICVGPTIKKLVVDYGNGEIEIDIEAMELRALMEMQTIGLDACADILMLVSALKMYQDGKRIGEVEK